MELPGGTVRASINDECLESWQSIGSGGFGEIYRAKHTRWGMDIAIKLLCYNPNSSDSCLLKEADLMRHGGNPNVLRILGVYEGCPGGQPPATRHAPCSTQLGLVMEYMERGSVADLLRVLGGPPPWPLAFRIMHQIALGMNFLHQLSPPLLHLDLKPSNVLLDGSLNAKLTDFGLAKLAQSYSNVDKKDQEEVGGTTRYMPPEAFEPCYTPTFSSDVYSYGILLWSVMSGKQPYHNACASSLIQLHVTEGVRPNLKTLDSSQEQGLSDLTDLMERCWDPDPNQRPTFLKCVNVTEKVYDLHKQNVHDAVSATLKQLEKGGIVIPPPKEPVPPGVTGVRFVEIHEAELIQRVSLVDPIADDLKLLIGNEKYANIRAATTSQDQMRVLYSFLQGEAVKEKFYQSLSDNEPFLVKDLAGTS